MGELAASMCCHWACRQSPLCIAVAFAHHVIHDGQQILQLCNLQIQQILQLCNLQIQDCL